jgi:N-methylhydantoinase A
MADAARDAPSPPRPDGGDAGDATAPRIRRQAYFGPARGHAATPVIRRATLTASPRQGPLIVEDYEGTTVVPPDAIATLDDHGNIVIELVEDRT